MVNMLRKQLKENYSRRQVILRTKFNIYTYHSSVSKSRQLVHIFRAKDLIEDKSNHDGIEDIIRLEIVSIEELKNMIKERRIQNAGTLIAYLICCTGIL